MMNKAGTLLLDKVVADRGGVESAVIALATENHLVHATAWPADRPLDEALRIIAIVALADGPNYHPPPDADPRIIIRPVQIQGGLAGVIAMRLIDLAAARPSGLVRPKAPPAPPAPMALTETTATLQLMRLVLAQPDFDRATVALANELAASFSSERVFVGMTEHHFVRVRALSHGASLGHAQALSRFVGAAMDEALEQGASILFPQHPADAPRITMAHAALANHVASHSVWLTVPLFADGEAVGALTLGRPNTKRFDSQEIQTIEAVAQAMAALLRLKFQTERSAWQRLRQRFDQHQAGTARRQRLGNAAAMLLGATALGGVMLIPWSYEITAPTRIEGQVQRAIVAPQDGILKTALVRAGDRVLAGQVLAELDDQDLQLERRRWETEVAGHENDFAKAQAKADRTDLVIADGRVAESQAQLALVDQQLTRTRLVAPFDALVIKGDLAQQLGAPLKRGDLLLTLTPTNDYRVTLEIDERDIGLAKPGEHGELTLSALPERSFGLILERIMPVAKTESGRNFFEAEARMDPSSHADALRPGMQGVARLDAGKRSLIWQLSHRALDWLRLQWWTWLG